MGSMEIEWSLITRARKFSFMLVRLFLCAFSPPHCKLVPSDPLPAGTLYAPLHPNCIVRLFSFAYDVYSSFAHLNQQRHFVCRQTQCSL